MALSSSTGLGASPRLTCRGREAKDMRPGDKVKFFVKGEPVPSTCLDELFDENRPT
jgi:hypothetical protein